MKRHHAIKTFIIISALVLCALFPASSIEAGTIKVKSITITGKDKKGYNVKWDRLDSDYVDGYQIQASPNRLFLSVKNTTAKKSETSKKTVLAAKYPYCYVRIRPYGGDENNRIYYEWTYSKNMKSDKRRPVFKYYKKKKQKLSLRKIAGQKVGKTDTVQGACTDGTYSYHALNDRNTGLARIVKTELATGKKVKVSKAMKLGHASDMTYDSKKKRIIMINTYTSRFKLTIINRKSLKAAKTFKVKIPKNLTGATQKKLKSITGFSGIAYNSSRNQYVLALLGRQDVIITDADFKPVRYIVCEYKKQGVTFGQGYNSQGIECTKDFILRSRSLGGNNLIAVYDYSGRFLSGLDVSDKYEIENLYISGKKLYADFYHSWREKKYRITKKKVYVAPGTVKQLTPKTKGRVIKVRWKKTAYAQKYQIYVKKGKNGKYFCLATTTSTSYRFKGKKKTAYYIRVRAVNGLMSGKFSNLKIAKSGKKSFKFKNPKNKKRKMQYRIVTEKHEYYVLHRENYITRFTTF